MLQNEDKSVNNRLVTGCTVVIYLNCSDSYLEIYEIRKENH